MTVAGSGVQSTEFAGLTIAFDDRVLRPRGWTAAQSEWADELLGHLPPGPVLELCTGAGHIGLRAVAPRRRRLVAVDVNPVACDFVHRNARAAGVGELVETRLGPMDEVLEADERFPLIIADPPWVPRQEVPTYPDDPVLAIDGGADGMDVVRTCLAIIGRHLVPGGSALLQLGTEQQADTVVTLLDTSPGGAALRRVEVRSFKRGVLVRLDRDLDGD